MTLDPQQALALASDPSLILAAQGIAPDPWQRAFLLSPARQALLNCSRQAECWGETQRGVFGRNIWADDSLWTSDLSACRAWGQYAFSQGDRPSTAHFCLALSTRTRLLCLS